MRVTESQKVSLQTLTSALNRLGLAVTESQLIEFLISTSHHYHENPPVLASALTEWRASEEAH